MMSSTQNGLAFSLWSEVHWKTLALIVIPTFTADLLLYCFAYPRPAVIGLLGDLYNFGAGIWFARDLLFKDREAEKKKVTAQLRRDMAVRELPLTRCGVPLSDPDAPERIFHRLKAGEALSACLLLGLGLVLVVVARLLEFMEQGKLDVMWHRF
jgi:hypothetical protein